MDVLLFIECEKRKENFDYEKELSEDEYIGMLRQASDSILGQDGFSKRNTLERRYGLQDAKELEMFYNRDDIEEKPFKATLLGMDYSDLSPQELVKYYNNGNMFITIVDYIDIDDPLLEDTLNIWITNSDHINNDPNLNDELKLKSLEPKKITLKFGNNYLTLIGCQVVEKISSNRFAMLVHKIEK